MAVVLLLGIALLVGGCTKPKATISPFKLSLHVGKTDKVFIDYQNITSYRIEVEDTIIAQCVALPSTNSNVPLDGHCEVTIIGKQIGSTNLLFLCPNEHFMQRIPVEVLDNK